MARPASRKTPARAPKTRAEIKPALSKAKSASDAAGEPTAKKNLKEVKKLIDLGKEKGYLTYDDVNDMLPAEANTIADYFSTVFLDDGMERYDANFTAAESARGQALYGQLGCPACHQLGASGGYVGPELSMTGARLKPGWISAWLTNPGKYKPGTLQPDYGLPAADVRALTAYLSTLGQRTGRNTAEGAR